MTEIITQKQWTDDELIEAGFRPYVRRKQVVMARQLPEDDSPREIPSNFETLVAESGYMICYEAGETVGERFEDYHRWPIRKDIFDSNYHVWDEAGWTPTPAQLHLMSLGCLPYYKVANVWARELQKDTRVQSLESVAPVVIPAGAWLCIGTEGEPYSMERCYFPQPILCRP